MSNKPFLISPIYHHPLLIQRNHKFFLNKYVMSQNNKKQSQRNLQTFCFIKARLYVITHFTNKNTKQIFLLNLQFVIYLGFTNMQWIFQICLSIYSLHAGNGVSCNYAKYYPKLISSYCPVTSASN